MAPPSASSHHHRPTTKKDNRAHKTKHASSRTLKDKAKGRSALNSAASRSLLPSDQVQNKTARKNRAKQIQLQKRSQLKAQFATTKNVPRIVTLLSLCSDVDLHAVLQGLFVDQEIEKIGSLYQVSVGKTVLQIITPAFGSFYNSLDAAQVSDFILLVFSSEQEVELREENLLRCLIAQGLPDSGLRSLVATLPSQISAQAGVKKSLLSFTNHFAPEVSKVYCVQDNVSEARSLVRTLVEPTLKGVGWREERARVLVESLDSSGGVLALTGFVRGANLSADRLLHIPSVGDFQIANISDASTSKLAPTMDVDKTFLDEPSEDADDLQSTNVPDDEELLLQEQTWPTEEEMQDASAQRHEQMLPPALPGTTPKRIKKVPKGTSVYQAAWLLDEDDEDGVSDGSDGSLMGADGLEQEEQDAEQVSVVASTSAPIDSYHDLDMDDEMEQYNQFKAKQKAAMTEDDVDFPDEVDTPQDVAARERFARYRGLKSFRTSPWDPYENLPPEYSRCFVMQNWAGMGRRMVEQARINGVPIGSRVTIHLKDAPADSAQRLAKHMQGRPLVVYGLHKHEHKYSVVHFAFQRNTEYEEDIRSKVRHVHYHKYADMQYKETMTLQLGPRRFTVNPLYSQHTQTNKGQGVNNVHKFLRFLPAQQTSMTVATVYLPITFGTNVPAMLIDPSSQSLVGSGALISCDPRRILAKRIILTGHPYKLHKHTATIRYLFFNPDDIAYFKPVQLKTKKGKIGNIQESLGTHGYLKAVFDAPLDPMDTVCLHLYKRCFPKWGQMLIQDEEMSENDKAMDIEMQ